MENSNNDLTNQSPILQREVTSGTRKPANKNVKSNDLKWEENHNAISRAIVRLTNKVNRMPLTSEIARECGLNRKTVIKHLTEDDSRMVFDKQLKHYNYMGGVVLAKILQKTMEGDMRAAKLYFDILYKQAKSGSQANTFVAHRENNLWINNTVISQADINNLPWEKKKEIEDMVIDQKLMAEEQQRIQKLRKKGVLPPDPPPHQESIDEIRERVAEKQRAEDIEDGRKTDEEPEEVNADNINDELLDEFSHLKPPKKRVAVKRKIAEEGDDFYIRTKNEIKRLREERERLKNEAVNDTDPNLKE